MTKLSAIYVVIVRIFQVSMVGIAITLSSGAAGADTRRVPVKPDAASQRSSRDVMSLSSEQFDRWVSTERGSLNITRKSPQSLSDAVLVRLRVRAQTSNFAVLTAAYAWTGYESAVELKVSRKSDAVNGSVLDGIHCYKSEVVIKSLLDHVRSRPRVASALLMRLGHIYNIRRDYATQVSVLLDADSLLSTASLTIKPDTKNPLFPLDVLVITQRAMIYDRLINAYVALRKDKEGIRYARFTIATAPPILLNNDIPSEEREMLLDLYRSAGDRLIGAYQNDYAALMALEFPMNVRIRGELHLMTSGVTRTGVPRTQQAATQPSPPPMDERWRSLRGRLEMAREHALSASENARQ